MSILTDRQLDAIRRRLESETRTLIARLGRECGQEPPCAGSLQIGAAILLRQADAFRKRPEHPAHVLSDTLHVAAMAVASLGAVVSQMDANGRYHRRAEIDLTQVRGQLHREANGALIQAREWLNLWANSREEEVAHA